MSETEAPLVLCAIRDGVATLTLNRPRARNALSVTLMDALQTELDNLAGDERARVVILAAEGPAFCAGHDLRELRAQESADGYQRIFEQASRLMLTISRLPQPVIARVQGPAWAAGCQIVATCDLAVAADTAEFATPGVRIGLFCSTPMVALSRAVPRKHALEMLLTGEAVSARHAAAIGLINRAVPEGELDTAVENLVAPILEKSPFTLGLGKEAFQRQLEMGVEEAYTYTTAVMTRNMCAGDAAEGIDAFLEKRAPEWTGS